MVATNSPVSSSPLPAAAFLHDIHDPMMDVCMSFGSSSSSMDEEETFFSRRNSTTQTPIDNLEGDGSSPSQLLQLLWRANSFMMQGLRSRDGNTCVPLLMGRRQVGILRRGVVALLARYPAAFTVTQDAVVISPQLKDYSSRSAAVAEALQDLRQAGETVALRSWRGENFVVWGQYGNEPLFEVERAAVALLGIRSFGVHITGYVRNAVGGVEGVWLQKRADDKPTYPGMMDTMVGGGLTAGLKPSEVLYKESAEEASIPAQLVDRAQAVGTVSFFTETERGLHANTEYVYDIELHPSFEPENSDGEVQGFIFVNIKDIMEYLLSPNYKLTSTPILIDFLIRHSIITSDNIPDLPEITEMLHTPLNHLYRSWPLFPAVPNTTCLITSLAGSAAKPEPKAREDNKPLLEDRTPLEESVTTAAAAEEQIAAERSEESDVRDESDQEYSDGI